MAVMTLKELKEQHARDQAAAEKAAQEPKPPVKNLYGDPAYKLDGAEKGTVEGPTREVVLEDEETGIVTYRDLLFRNTHPCLFHAAGSCLTRDTKVSEVCENCWDFYRMRHGMDEIFFWD